MRIVGQTNLADLFGVAPKTIVEWQEQGLPVAVRGGPHLPNEYDTEGCIRWLVDREVRKVRAESPKDRLARLQGDEKEIQLAQLRGRLIPADAIEPAMKAAVVAARERIRDEPARIATLMEGVDQAGREALLRELFDEVLVKLSRWQSGQPSEEAAP